MRVGVTLWGFAIGVRASVDLAVLAEERGFDSVLMVEGVMSNDAVTTVAGMAARTSRIVIGTGIANIYLRHPVMLGIAAAAIDELAGGRLVLGLGPNNAEMITRAGLSWRDPRQALRETTETLRGVLAGQGVAGLRPLRPAAHPIPIHWAAMALETCEAAGAHADGLMLYLCSRMRYRRAVERMRRGAESMRRNPADIAVSVLIPTFVHEDLAAARQAAREFLLHYAGMSHYARAFEASGFEAEMQGVRDALAAGNPSAAKAALSDRLLDEVLLVGPAARCREQLRAFREEGWAWVTLGPQRVGEQDLEAQARVVLNEFAVR
ncbi:MAG TPA: LLM class flavin-dependent oxidoreductase [Candidatus Methylomirabilis sp.]|nr:LLM class flavin-dependent oxidoreductase [Candidatus Methylomirabilis sp.]